jgi:hypothetical protein
LDDNVESRSPGAKRPTDQTAKAAAKMMKRMTPPKRLRTRRGTFPGRAMERARGMGDV